MRKNPSRDFYDRRNHSSRNKHQEKKIDARKRNRRKNTYVANVAMRRAKRRMEKELENDEII